MRIFWSVVLSVLLLSGCAAPRMVDWKGSTVVNALPKNLSGATYAIFLLDKNKSIKLESTVIQRHIVSSLSKKGLVLIDNPRKTIPKYFIFFDYASDLGIDDRYEHALAVVVYELGDQTRQVYKARLKIDSAENNVVESVNKAFDELVARSPG